jgi:hypothetical protein
MHYDKAMEDHSDEQHILQRVYDLWSENTDYAI